MTDATAILFESLVTQLVSEGSQGPSGPPGPSLEEEMTYAKRVDFVGDTVIYRGEAPVGALNSLSSWRIRRITLSLDGDVLEEWAQGTASFDKVWNDRASLSYS